MDAVTVLLNAEVGLVAGCLVGALMKRKARGIALNALLGAIGGLAGGALGAWWLANEAGLTTRVLGVNLFASGLGGASLTWLVRAVLARRRGD